MTPNTSSSLGPNLSNKEVKKLKEKSHSHGNFAVKLLNVYFTNHELSNPNIILNEKKSNGSANQPKALDHVKISEIKDEALAYVQGPDEVKKRYGDHVNLLCIKR